MPQRASSPSFGVAGFADATFLYGTPRRNVFSAEHRASGATCLVTLGPSADAGSDGDATQAAIQVVDDGGQANLAPAVASGVSRRRPWVAVERPGGKPVRDVQRSRKPLDGPTVVGHAVAYARAMHAGHEQGALVGDLISSDLWLDRVGLPVLTGFGLAAFDGLGVQDEDTPATIMHWAPERLAGGPPTVAADVYSLASVLVQLLAGTAPFERAGRDSLVALSTRIATEPPPDLRSTGLPAPHCAILEQALAKDPAQRPASAAQLAFALEAANEKAGIAPVSTAPAAAPPPRAAIPPPGRAAAPPPGRAVAPPPGRAAAPPPPTGWTPAPAPATPSPANRKPIAILAAIAVVVVLGVVGFLVVGGGGDDDDDDGSASATTNQPEGEEGSGGFALVSDDSGAISFDAPLTWTDVNGSASDTGPALTASTDLAGFNANYSTAGVSVSATRQTPVSEVSTLLDSISSTTTQACTSTGRSDYSAFGLAGQLETFTGCDGTDFIAVTFALADAHEGFVVFGIIQVPSDDAGTADRILSTLNVVPAGGF